jgi:two-component system phosphate regulon sensor histidine kinase PhoR
MAEQTGHMGKLVEDLLCLSKAEMSENTIPTEEVNILDILEKSIRSSTLLAKNKNISVHYKRGKELPIIIGDARELEQVFINLISNAIKYSPNDTNVTIKAAKRNDEIRLSFQDEGDGIAKEDISRITERFFRVDKVRSRKVGGTGIGLAIVKHILNRHKARLDIKSTVGKGSRFTVILPTGIEEA